MILYGIKNCDTVRKARQWLAQHHFDVSFHDLRIDGTSHETLTLWCQHAGWEKVLNKRSTSYRALDDADKMDLNQTKAIALMLAYPTLIKRPILIVNDHIEVGFNEKNYKKILAL